MVIWILAAGIGLGFVAERVVRSDQAAVGQQVHSNDDWNKLNSLAEQGEWSSLWWALPKVAYFRPTGTGPVVLAGLAGCFWLAFLWHAMKLPGWRDMRLWCLLLALPLGVLSIWPTLFWSYWQEQVWNLHESPELIRGMRYYVLSVGLREELAKLLCLLPLMPILLKLRDELTVLLVSGGVGLGFAIVENISYFAGSRGTATLVRFLMANPFHITLTALAGLAMYRALRYPKGWGTHSLGTLGILIFAHGFYDAFFVLPALFEYQIVGTIIFALVVYQFFRELRELRTAQRDTISLSATFLGGVSLLTAATFIYLSGTLGTTAAFDNLAAGILGQAVMVYLFLREMPETMVTV